MFFGFGFGIRGNTPRQRAAPYADNTALLAGLGSDLYEFWDADVLASFNITSANNVQAWTGLKQGLAPFQNTEANKPQYAATGWNGAKPALSFNGVAQRLQSTLAGQLPIGSTPCEIWGLASQDSVGTTTRLVQWGSSATGAQTTILHTQTSSIHRLRATGSDGVASNSAIGPPNSAAPGTKFQFRGIIGPTTVELGYDTPEPGSSVANVLSGVSGTSIAIGSSVGGGSPWQGLIRKLLITKPLTVAQVDSLYGYLQAAK